MRKRKPEARDGDDEDPKIAKKLSVAALPPVVATQKDSPAPTPPTHLDPAQAAKKSAFKGGELVFTADGKLALVRTVVSGAERPPSTLRETPSPLKALTLPLRAKPRAHSCAACSSLRASPFTRAQICFS